MRPVTIPIHAHTEDSGEALQYMAMPREMTTFEMPRPPAPSAEADVAGARTVLLTFHDAMARWLQQGGEPPVVELAGLPGSTLRAINETLGEGEVSAIIEPVAAADGGAPVEIRIQETVFSGIWREQHFQGERLLHDGLLAAPIPPRIGELARAGAQPRLRAIALPAGAMNVPALLHELQEAMAASGDGVAGHIVNLTLLPLSVEDAAHLDAVLDGGRVVVLSRGFGNCRISSTAATNVWRVQYFNNMNTLILNTIEVVTMPVVALAAREDLVESHGRLADLLQWMGDSLADA